MTMATGTKKIYKWEMDSQSPADSHEIQKKDSPIHLTISRMKDRIDQKEKLIVAAEYCSDSQNTPLGEIKIDPAEIESGLAGFKEYGVMLSRPDCIEIAKVIRENYYSFSPLPCYDGCTIDQAWLQDILSFLNDIITDSDITEVSVSPRNQPNSYEVYPIPVTTFNEAIENSQYSFTPKALKEYLFQEGFTVTNKGQYDYVMPIPNDEKKKKQKYICLIKAKLDKAISQEKQV